MILDRFPDIEKLTKDERMELYCELQDLVMKESDLVHVDPGILAMLEERHRHYVAHPETARPASEVMAELRAKYIEPGKKADAEARGA